ncbi:MAG: hypothetical protein JO022_14195, partial [Acidobacteriaceae bacterium]|nr:hypothetical protein [Acidobacteriaceae bacterium]
MSSNPQTAPTPERIMQLCWAFAPPVAVEAAIRNHVFDALSDGPKTVGEVAQKTGASQRGLSALMNLLVGLKLLDRADSQYALTPESQD